MSRKLWGVGIAVMCLPLLFVLWLLLASSWQKMDAITLRMPMGLRSLVAQVVAQNRSNLKRAKALDPSVEPPREIFLSSINADLEAADKANSDQALKLSEQAQAQEKSGDVCAAADTYATAAGKVSGSDADYAYAEGMGRDALFCGDLATARAGLESAVQKQERYLKLHDNEEDDIVATKKDMLKDREFLIVIYQREKEPRLAADTCSTAHPEWKTCTCKLVGKNASCTGH